MVAFALFILGETEWEDLLRVEARMNGATNGRSDYRNGVRKLHRRVHDGSQRPMFLGMDGPFEIWTDPQPEEPWWSHLMANPLEVEISEHASGYEKGMRDAFRKEQEKKQTTASPSS
jgi:hypothetical protein